MTKEQKEKAQQARAAIFNDGVQGLRNKKRGQLGGWLLLATALILTLIIVPKGGLIPDYHAPGEIASRDIKSPRDLLVEDAQLTREKQVEAAAVVPLVYEYDRLLGTNAIERIGSGLELLLQYQEAEEKQIREDFLLHLEEKFGVPLTDEDYLPLSRLPLDQGLAALTVDLLTPVFTRPVVANLNSFQEDFTQGLTLMDRNDGQDLGSALLDRTIGLSEALEQAQEELAQIVDITVLQKQMLLKIVQQQLRPNLTYNQSETERRRQAASDEVAPVLFQVKKGEMVVREGERVTADQILKLRAIRDSGRDSRSLQTAAGLLICILLLIYIGFYFAQQNVSKFGPDSRDLLFLTAVFISLFVLIKLSIVISAGMANTFTYFDSSVYFYAIPFALGAMLVRIVLNSETAFLFAGGCSFRQQFDDVSVCLGWKPGRCSRGSTLSDANDALSSWIVDWSDQYGSDPGDPFFKRSCV